MSITYVALVHRAKKKGAVYGVIFPDFPGCVSAGKTLEEALENAREGLLFHIDGLLDAGEVLPEPTSLETVKNNAEYKVATPSLIRIIVPAGHLKRINVSMDAGLLAEIDRFVNNRGGNRSEFLAAAARHLLA